MRITMDARGFFMAQEFPCSSENNQVEGFME
jgi:hypothetical protein